MFRVTRSDLWYTGAMLTKRQEAELVTAIQGRGEIPLKFAYLGEGAKHWDAIARERSTGEGINSEERKLLDKRVHDFLSGIDTSVVNIVDIGCGNGEPVLPIMEALQSKNVGFSYVPLDISSEMIELARHSVSAKYPDVSINPIVMDFESGQFSEEMYDLKTEGSINLMLFLGNTMGNHSDLNRVLSNFRDSMTSKDYLIVGNELTNLAKVEKILPHYETKAVGDLVTQVLDHLSIDDKTYDYAAHWNEKYSQIEMRALFHEDVPVSIAGESFVLEKGERLLLARSRKFTEYTATKLFTDVGFRTELLSTSVDQGYILTMVQPTRYSV
jgi:uncharacterized SAM-dependent methyltransferase